MLDITLIKGGQATHAASCAPSGKPLTPYILRRHEAGREPNKLYNTTRFCTSMPTQGYGNTYQAHSQGHENTTYLSSPDTWVRKPDCLCLSYDSPLLVSSPCSLHKDVFHEGPSVRRAEPCTHTHNSSTGYSNKLTKHKQCCPGQQEPTALQWLGMPTIPVKDRLSGLQWSRCHRLMPVKLD